MKRLICCVCNGAAFGKQWWNRDKGFGICPRCAKEEAATLTKHEMLSCYGYEGKNYTLQGATMKIELRSFKMYPRLSEETTAFNAKVYVDGVLAGDASNRGHGEPVLVNWKTEAIRDAFMNYIGGLPPVVTDIPGAGPFTYPVNEDNFFSELVEKHALCAQLKMWAKNGKTVARLKTDKPGEWFVTKQTSAGVRKRFGMELEMIANDNFEKAAGLEV